jgi:hypothetical protein
MGNRKRLQSVLTVAVIVLVVLAGPLVLSRHVLYRVNLGQVGLDNDGYVHLEGVPMEAGVKYTIYLSYLPGFGFPPSFESSTSPEGATRVSLYDGDLKSIPNQIKWYTAYCTLSESASSIAVYTAQKHGPQSLKLRFSEHPKQSFDDYELVIRRTSLSSPVLLILSDKSNLLYLIAIGLWWGYKKARE